MRESIARNIHKKVIKNYIQDEIQRETGPDDLIECEISIYVWYIYLYAELS